MAAAAVPYTARDAGDWLALSAEAEQRGDGLEFAVRDAGDGRYARGRGFAARAVRLLAASAFAGIFQGDDEPWVPRRIELLVQPENVASRRTCEQAGTTFDGIRRAGLWLRADGAHPAAVYSLVPPDVADP